MGWQDVGDETKRLRVKRNMTRALDDMVAQACCPLCKAPLYVVMTARGPAWQCGCEELKRQKVAAAAA